MTTNRLIVYTNDPSALKADLMEIGAALSSRGVDVMNPNNPQTYSLSRIIAVLVEQELERIQGDDSDR